jgi:serine/threonine protein kinase
MSGCPSREQLALLLAEQLGTSEAGPVEAHVQTCGRCQDTLAALSAADFQQPPSATGRPTARFEPSPDFLRRLREINPSPTLRDDGAADYEPVPSPDPGWPQLPGYEILGELGRGGMGVVYRARHLALKRLVALKMIRPGDAGPEELERFRVEAEAVARLQHPHIVQIFEIGAPNGLPFMALELVEGECLARHLDGQPVPGTEAARLIRTLARAAHYAHQHGIVHRDLKPANVLLEFSREPGASATALAPGSWLNAGVPKVTDFGLAKLLDAPAALTQTGAILGTPSYMAPEQAGGKGQAIGPAADVYALGAILYELLTGRPPFEAATPLDTLLQVVREEAVPPHRREPRVPRDLDTICRKCLEKDPHRRYVSAADLAGDLESFLNHEPIRARPPRWWEQGARWVRRRPAAALAGLALALALTAAAAGYWLWHQLQVRDRADAEARAVHVAYFAHLMDRRGVMQGIDPLTAEQAHHRQVTYKVYRRGGRVERIDVVNGSQALTGRHFLLAFLDRNQRPGAGERECSYHYQRDRQGYVTRVVARAKTGRSVWTLHFTSPTTAHYTDRRGFPRPRAGSGAAYVRFVWSKEGWPREVWYLDPTGRRKPDRNGVYGEKREYDRRGHLTRLTYVDRRGRPARSKDRVAGFRASYDERGNRTGVAFFGVTGRPAVFQNGAHRWQTRFDRWGNPVEERYFDTAGKPVGIQGGLARVVFRYDARGNQVEETYFGPADRPALHPLGYHRAELRYDDRGNPRVLAYFDRQGRPTLTIAGYHRAQFRYDRADRAVAMSLFGKDGRPVCDLQGIHRWTKRYDHKGNCTAVNSFGTDGRPALHKEGFAKKTLEYDRRGNQTAEAYFGRAGKPVVITHGYHRWKAAYDGRNNQVELAFWGAAGRPCRHPLGYHKWKARYDAFGNQPEMAFFGTKGEPVVLREGFHKWVKRFDDCQRLAEIAFFGSDGKPVMLPTGYHKQSTRYDRRDNPIERRYFGPDGRPTLPPFGFTRLTTTYNRRNQATDERAYDLKGKRVALEVYLTKVQPGTQAQRVGLRVGDVLRSYDGKPVRNRAQFGRLRDSEPLGGAPHRLEVWRQGKRLVVKVPPGTIGMYTALRAWQTRPGRQAP